MLLLASALKGRQIDASDGRIGTVSDFLFDDRSWKIRWLVVNVGSWLANRKVLLHPSAILGADQEGRELAVRLTKKQVEGSPETREDEPVSRQIEHDLSRYYGWDALWAGDSYFATGMMASPLLSPAPFGPVPAGAIANENEGDPHLRSIAAVTGSHVRASDGEVGHIEDLLIDRASWTIHYLIVDTKNWWPGKHVLISPYAVQDIDYLDREIRVKMTTDQVKASPPWEPPTLVELDYQKRLHSHYEWPGYGW